MANEYIDLNEFKAFTGRTTTDRDAQITRLLTVASRWIDSHCGRRFYADANATTRTFHPTSHNYVRIDDALEITGVAVDDADDGSYSTAWAAGDYQKLPVNNIGPNGLANWPTTGIQSIEQRWFPTHHARPAVRVTAKWGWAAVPADVEEACLYYAQRLFYLIDAPSGSIQSIEFGATSIRPLRDIEAMLLPYVTSTAADAKFRVA